MPITIGSTIASLMVQRQLGRARDVLSSASERLASGQRINRASDDAAGLAVSASLNTDARVFNQAVRNVNDVMSFLGITDGATNALKDTVIRMRELATQASNGTLGNTQRKALDVEAQELANEYNRILATTEMNGINPFESSGLIRVQAGYSEIEMALREARIVGDGTFQVALSFVGGLNPYGMDVADVNRDGVPDIVVASTDSNVAAALIGRGDGTFDTLLDFGAAVDPMSVAAADMNGDGIVDMVLGGQASQGIAVRFGIGDGTFGTATSYAAVGTLQAIAVADTDGDGVLDVVAKEQSGTVSVYLGAGDGTLQAPTTLVLSDSNSDGVPDHAIAATDPAVAELIWGGAVADLNGDGIQDLVHAQSATVRFGNGNGSFSAGVAFSSFGYSNVAFGDFNGDGLVDIVATDSSANTASVLLGSGSGSFGAPLTLGTGARPGPVVVADFNRDGALDFATSDGDSNSVSVFIGNTEKRLVPIIVQLDDVSVATRASALAAQDRLDTFLADVNTFSGIVGSWMSRFAVIGAALQTASDRYQEASARITDADIADESSKLVRAGILQQAGAAVLAQANQQPALAIQLLQG